MELQRTGYGPKIALAAALAVLVVGYDVFVAIHLVIAGTFPNSWSISTLYSAFSALMILLVTIGLCFGVWSLVVRQREAQALAARDPSVVGEASPQPDSALALPAGESLTLTRRYSLNAVFHNLMDVLFLPWLVFVGEILIFQVLPSFGRSPLNPYYHARFDGPPGPSPTTLDWLAAALPVLLVAGMMGYMAWRNTRDRSSKIVADDRGITIRNGLRRRRIRWGEIELFARLPDGTTSSLPGSYVVWGRSKSLNFHIPRIEQQPDYNPGSSSWETRYVFAGGYNRYVRDVRRLLATVTARTHTPLLTMRAMPGHFNQSRGEAAIAAMTEADALALPLAAPCYVSSGDPASGVLDAGEHIALRAHTWPLPVTGDWLNDFTQCLLTIVFWGWALGLVPEMSSYRLPLTLALVAVLLVLLILYVVLFRRQRPYRFMPDVSADETGLTTFGRYKDQPVTIPWQSIAAWVIVPPKPGTTRPFRHVVFGDGLRIAWAEPNYGQYSWESVGSGPYQDYRKHAIRLHALIAARTGLPLRELRLDNVPAGWAS